MKIVATIESPDAETFHREIRAACEPVMMKGLVANMTARATNTPLTYSIGDPAIKGRFHYTDDVRQLNFSRVQATLHDFLHMLLAEASTDSPHALAAQGIAVHECLPGFSQAHPLWLLPPTVMPRMWIGNAAKVATHNDELENIACVAAGRRRFTLFPPEAVADLYMGPFELTPGGTPISMVHVTAPDLLRFPRFENAVAVAQVAEMEAGDALYIPYQWYHHVEALDSVNILVNYWWDPARQDLGSPWDALLHGITALRGLPADQRRAWKAVFDHYVFLENGDPGAHLPSEARGVLAQDSPEDISRFKRNLFANLGPNGHEKQGPFR